MVKICMLYNYMSACVRRAECAVCTWRNSVAFTLIINLKLCFMHSEISCVASVSWPFGVIDQLLLSAGIVKLQEIMDFSGWCWCVDGATDTLWILLVGRCQLQNRSAVCNRLQEEEIHFHHKEKATVWLFFAWIVFFFLVPMFMAIQAFSYTLLLLRTWHLHAGEPHPMCIRHDENILHERLWGSVHICL